MTELQDNLPPGWDSKIDARTGRRYFINHYSKTTSWEDPRHRFNHHGTPLHVTTAPLECIQMQHGSPDLKRNSVYPSQPSPIPAFQMPGQCSPKFIPLQEFRPNAHMSPLSVRTTKIQDSSFTSVPDADDAVYKISAMFPTVSDTHIRLLLKKFHNREAIVISALQVEKHPIVTPGPFATPPPTRSIHFPTMQMTPPLGVRTISRTSSPTLRTTSCTNSTYTGSPRVGEAYRNTYRPHSSPKLKLRYMKSIFPDVEETMILDILSNNDNNILKASDNLKEMGFVKKDSIKVRELNKVDVKLKQEESKLNAASVSAAKPNIVPMKSNEEKQAIKSSLQTAYKDIPERVIQMALESVNFDEERAKQILKIMVQEDTKLKDKTDSIDVVLNIDEENDLLTGNVSHVQSSQSRQSLKSLLKDKPENSNKTTFHRVIDENMSTCNNEYKSHHLSSTHGSNPANVRGANEKLLLEDYIKWQGPNPKLRSGVQPTLAKGPNRELLSAKKNYKPLGANPELAKGPTLGLAKGSIFSQLRNAFGESRGK